MADTLELDPSEISESSRLVEDLDADSIDLLEMVLALKDDFRISVHDGEVKQLLVELAQFLPEGVTTQSELSDDELGEITRRLQVRTIVDFVAARAGAPA